MALCVMIAILFTKYLSKTNFLNLPGLGGDREENSTDGHNLLKGA